MTYPNTSHQKRARRSGSAQSKVTWNSLIADIAAPYQGALRHDAPHGTQAVPGVVKDAVGNVLQDGDSVVVVKALKVRGSPSGIEAGTKVRGIRLVDGVDGHDIDCKIDGFGAMQLKSGVVRKA